MIHVKSKVDDVDYEFIHLLHLSKLMTSFDHYKMKIVRYEKSFDGPDDHPSFYIICCYIELRIKSHTSNFHEIWMIITNKILFRYFTHKMPVISREYVSKYASDDERSREIVHSYKLISFE